MFNLFLFIVNKFTKILPPSRFATFVPKLYKIIGVKIGNNTKIYSSCNLWIAKPIEIGSNTFIGHEVLITGGYCNISIGSYVDIAPRVSIISGSHEIDMENVRSAGFGYSEDIIIEDGVWIGAGSLILGGVTIGEKTIVAAGSMVNKNLPSNVIAAGIPCKPIKKWNSVFKKWENV